jgi:hypothetical protein
MRLERVLYFQCKGEWYKVKRNGDMIHTANRFNEWGHCWRLLGISRHWNSRHISATVEDFFKFPGSMIGGYVWDNDHGTVRAWGGSYNGKLPRVTGAYTRVDEVYA